MDDIKEILDGLAPKGWATVFGTYREVNYEVDRLDTETPVFVQVAQIAGEFDLDTFSILHDTQNVMVLFIERDKKGSGDSDHTKAIIDRMKAEAVAFLRRVKESGLFQPLQGKYKYSCIVKDFNRCYSGIALQLDLTLVEPTCL